MIKVNYDSQTTLVKGYYPDSVKYPSIPEPFIEIEDGKQDNTKQMCVIDGVYQEYIKPLDVQLQEAKTSKIAQLDINRNDFCLIPIEYQDNTYATTINAWAAISYLANGLSTLSTTAEYPNYPQGDNITLTKQDFKNIAGLIQIREMFSRDKRKDLMTQINACTTIEEVEAININF